MEQRIQELLKPYAIVDWRYLDGYYKNCRGWRIQRIRMYDPKEVRESNEEILPLVRIDK